MPATVAFSAAISSFCSELSYKEKRLQIKSQKEFKSSEMACKNSETGIALIQVNFGTIIKEKLM